MSLCTSTGTIEITQACAPLPTQQWLLNPCAALKTAWRSNPLAAAPNNDSLIGASDDIGTFTTVKVSDQSTSTLAIPSLLGIGYSEVNDKFITTEGVGNTLKLITPQPLAIFSSLAIPAFGTTPIIRYNPWNQLVYMIFGSGVIGVYDPVGNAMVGSYDTGSPFLAFHGNISFDAAGKMYVGFNDSNVAPEQGYLDEFDISGVNPVLLNQYLMPFTNASGSHVYQTIYCPENQLVYCQGRDKALPFVNSGYVTRLNPATGLFQNTQFRNGIPENATPVYNPTKKQVYLANDNIPVLVAGGFDIVCATDDSLTGSFAVPVNDQSCYVGTNGSVAIPDGFDTQLFDYS